MHPEVREWFGWRNGLRRDRERDPEDYCDYFLPWGQQLSLHEALNPLTPAWKDTQDFARRERLARPMIQMHDAGFPILNNQWIEISVECSTRGRFGAVWSLDPQLGARIAHRSLTSLVQCAILFFRRGWLMRHRHGGIRVVGRDALTEWAERNPTPALTGNWQTPAAAWGYDPLNENESE